MVTPSMLEYEGHIMYHEITEEIESEIAGILEGYDHAVLGTLDANGFPNVTKVCPAYLAGDIYILMSDLSQHTRNIKDVSDKCSLYFAPEETHTNSMNNPRVTMTGTLKKYDVEFNDYVVLLDEFDKRTPGANMYGQFDDFAIYKFVVEDRLYVEGFGKAYK